MRARVFMQFALVLLVVSVACKKKEDRPPVDDFVTGVSTVGTNIQATQNSGTPPAASANGPAATATGNSNVVTGGSNAYGVTGSTPFTRVFVSVGDVPEEGGAGGGVAAPSAVGFPQANGPADGFFQLDLPAPVTSVQLIVSFGREIPEDNFDLLFQVANAAGTAGSVSTIPATVLNAATGDVQITATWDAPSDVDLHVQEPNGNEIFWNAPTSSTGGALDLDSNPDCVIDNQNAENIRWPAGQAPIGTYIVRLHYFANCGVNVTNFVVTVNNGGQTSVFTGTFTGAGPQDGNGLQGSGRLITTFTRNAGSVIAPLNSVLFGDRFRTPPVPSPGKLRTAREREARRR